MDVKKRHSKTTKEGKIKKRLTFKDTTLKRVRFSTSHLVIFGLLFGAIAGYAIYSSFAASPAGTANLFVVPSGGSASCVRASSPVTLAQAAANNKCSSILSACTAHQAGDTAIVENGTYSGDLRTCLGHASDATDFIYKTEPGQECTTYYPNVPDPYTDTSCPVKLTSLNMRGANEDRTCGVASGNPLPSTLTPAQRASWINHIEFDDMYISGLYTQCASFITFRNVDTDSFFLREGSYHVWVLGGSHGNDSSANVPTIGDTTCGCSNWPPAEDVEFVNGVYHDFVEAGPVGSAHGDGIFIMPSYGTKIIGNVFARDDILPIYVNFATSSAQPYGVKQLQIIGNVLHTCAQHVQGGSACAQSQTIGLGNNYLDGALIAFNSVEGGIRRYESGCTSTCTNNVQFIGNIATGLTTGLGGSGCSLAGESGDYNVWYQSGAGSCGAHDNIGAGSPYTSTDTQPNAGQGDPMFFCSSW